MENLFSYGTLQLPNVQLKLFGRLVEMTPDALVGYKKEMIRIKIDSVINSSGLEEHLIIDYTGNEADVVDGVVLSISSEELQHADEYETEDYKRIAVTMKSGKTAWVYVKK